MVVSKKCKICSSFDANNDSITGEYFGKLIPDLIRKICCIEIDLRKANGVLICQQCILQLMLTDVIIDKFRKAVERLKKNENTAKPKTPTKRSSAVLTKKIDVNNTLSKNGELKQETTNESIVESHIDEKKKLKTPKNIKTLKSVFPDERKMDTNKGNSQNKDAPNALNDVKFEKLLDNDMTTMKASKRLTTFLANVVDPPSVKLSKTMSVSLNEEIPMDLTIDDDESKNETSINDSKIKVMNCVLCGKVFNSKSVLRGHIETAHMGERLKACAHCSSEFRSQQKYETHVFSEKCKNNNHACQYPKCNKRFKTVHKMELHMQEKHTSQNHSGSE